MQKATATYVAPFGDNKVVEMGGVTFFDGKATEINSFDNPNLIQKLQGNPHFDIEVGKEDDQPKPKAKRGRPSAADIAAAQEASDNAEREKKKSADKAEEAKAHLDEATKENKADAPAKTGGIFGSSEATKPAPAPATAPQTT